MRQLKTIVRQVRAVLACGLAAVAISALGAAILAPAQSGAAATHTTVTWAEPPQATPNYILPFYSAAFDSILNLYDFQSLMFRPLYYFGGKTASEKLNPTISIAQAPVYSNNDTRVTVALKNYRWSDGTQLDADNVLFWFNMLHAEKTIYGNYVPGGLSIPTTIKSITVKTPSVVVFTLTRSLNPSWFTNDQFWEPVPMPLAWTKTSTAGAAGSGGCATAPFGTADTKCAAVFDYLSGQAGFNPTKPTATNDALPTYATNPLWQVVDGPFHLKSFSATGDVSMVPNPDYSGPNKPTMKTFVEKPFSTSGAEYNSLVTGGIDVGYLPAGDVTSPTTTARKAGKNNPRLAATFNLSPLNGFRINFIPYNYKSTGDGGEAGKIFSQLYFRQAMQYLVDQPIDISRISKGYAVPDYGPVPITPPNPYTSKLEKSNPYPYNPKKASALLKQHGWKVVRNGTDVCEKPTKCGKGVKKGAKLSFQLLYAGGTPQLKTVVTAEESSWSTVGIHVSLRSQSTDTVLGTATPCATGCSWEMADWGAGYVDTGYPSEPVLFETGAFTNFGSYSSSRADALIKQTQLQNVKLTKYENYLAEQLPVMWQPNFATSITEIHKGLTGVLPQNPIGSITPANWHWTS